MVGSLCRGGCQWLCLRRWRARSSCAVLDALILVDRLIEDAALKDHFAFPAATAPLLAATALLGLALGLGLHHHLLEEPTLGLLLRCLAHRRVLRKLGQQELARAHLTLLQRLGLLVVVRLFGRRNWRWGKAVAPGRCEAGCRCINGLLIRHLETKANELLPHFLGDLVAIAYGVKHKAKTLTLERLNLVRPVAIDDGCSRVHIQGHTGILWQLLKRSHTVILGPVPQLATADNVTKCADHSGPVVVTVSVPPRSKAAIHVDGRASKVLHRQAVPQPARQQPRHCGVVASGVRYDPDASLVPHDAEGIAVDNGHVVRCHHFAGGVPPERPLAHQRQHLRICHLLSCLLRICEELLRHPLGDQALDVHDWRLTPAALGCRRLGVHAKLAGELLAMEALAKLGKRAVCVRKAVHSMELLIPQRLLTDRALHLENALGQVVEEVFRLGPQCQSLPHRGCFGVPLVALPRHCVEPLAVDPVFNLRLCLPAKHFRDELPLLAGHPPADCSSKAASDPAHTTIHPTPHV
mmetsp:Transcript_16852/g.39546  ORF Transcript_16852/g.39546 Transcript_16852/m.39546 type:complete len:523 (-) Transcript_16852:9-1577(-)